MTSPALTVDVWSDVVCPWCCIGRTHLQHALASFEHADHVALTWRSFELDAGAPRTSDLTLAEQLAGKYGIAIDQVDGLFDDVRERAAAVGLDFRFDIARPGNTFDAHRLLHLARQSDCQDDLKGRLFHAYFTEGQPVGDPTTLAALAVEVGLDGDEVAAVLGSDRFAADVRADEATARALGVTGVPFFVVDGRLGVAGAQPPEHLLAVLRRAWSERAAA